VPNRLEKKALYEGHGFSRATPVSLDEGFSPWGTWCWWKRT